MSNLLNHSRLFLKRNASTILTCVGGVGVIATSVMTAKETPKALKLLEHAEEEKGEKLTVFETVRVAAPAYIPAILVGASTIACIFGANMFNKRSQASLMSAYALLDSSYKEYKDKVKELYGEESDILIKTGIAQDTYEEDDIPEDEDDGKELFYDSFSDRYFRSTIEDVQRAEYRVNRTLVMRDYVYLNEFYELLGIEPIESGYTLGWSTGSCLACYWQSWIDFTHTKVLLDDNLECHIVTMQCEPLPNFADYS